MKNLILIMLLVACLATTGCFATQQKTYSQQLFSVILNIPEDIKADKLSVDINVDEAIVEEYIEKIDEEK